MSPKPSEHNTNCTPNVTVPADGHNHGIVFDFLKLASVREGLQHCLPRLKTLHALESTQQFRGQTNKDDGSYESVQKWKTILSINMQSISIVYKQSILQPKAKPYQEGGGHVNEQPILIQDVDEGQIVSHSDLVVVVVVRRGDFDGA